MESPSEKIAFETKQQIQEPLHSDSSLKQGSVDEDREVFKKDVDGVDFRTVTWQRAIIIFIKSQIATGVLGIPSALYTLGAVGGGLCVVGFQALNLYTVVIAGNFRNNHPECHTIVDMAGVIWGPIGREIIGVVFVLAFILCTGSSLLGISIAFNALSEHGACSVIFTFVGMVMTIIFSCIRTWGKMTWPLLIGFISVMAGVLVVVIGVTFNDRPAAAPQTGPYELGFYAIAYPTFAAGMTAACSIFVSSCGCPGYLPILAEMKRPQDFKKAAYIVAVLVGAVYLSFSMVMYRWCGQWIASPSLGSAGPLLKKIAYGIALPSLVVSAGIFNHTSSKYLFVRFLRNTKHLQSNSLIHWSTWIGCNVSVCLLAFIMAEAIPVFNYILALLAAMFLAPMSLICPPFFWMYDNKHYRTGTIGQKTIYGAHLFLAALGAFMCVGGTYGAIVSIKDSYVPGSVFSCADNSNTVGV